MAEFITTWINEYNFGIEFWPVIVDFLFDNPLSLFVWLSVISFVLYLISRVIFGG